MDKLQFLVLIMIYEHNQSLGKRHGVKALHYSAAAAAGNVSTSSTTRLPTP